MKEIKIKSLRRVKLNADDVVIIEAYRELTVEQIEMLLNQAKKIFPMNKIVITSPKIKLKVVSNINEVPINAI
jgi:molybdopterin-guanine dinucleotide biosynthesis protein